MVLPFLSRMVSYMVMFLFISGLLQHDRHYYGIKFCQPMQPQ